MPDRELDLPPGFTQVRLRESGDAVAHALKIAAEAGAATLVYVARYDIIEFAVVLEPGEPLAGARRAFFAGMNALADALAVHAPPERGIAFRWPDAILLDDGLLGGGRLVAPKDCMETEVPEWLVFGGMLRAADMTHVDPGFAPGATTLVAEGFEVIDGDLIIESFARHLMTAFDRWNESGFRAIGEDYLSRLPKKVASERRILDANGDLVVGLPSAAKPERFSLAEGLTAAAWYDPIHNMPRSR